MLRNRSKVGGLEREPTSFIAFGTGWGFIFGGDASESLKLLLP